MLEVEIGKIQERLDQIPNDTPEEEIDWLEQELNELSIKLNELYVES